MNNSQRNLTSTDTDKSIFIRKNKSLYVEKSARSKSIKYRFLTYIKKAATIEFQKDIIYKSLFTKNEFVKKFIDQALINKLRLQEITDYHYNIINDKSIVNESIQEKQNLKDQAQNIDFQSKITKHLTFLITLLNMIPLILPENKFKILWDLISIMGRLYFLFLIPVELAWTSQHLLYYIYKEATIFWLIILLIDLLLSLNTAYYQSGQLEKSRKRIIKYILSKAYGLECISLFIILIFLIIESQAIHDLNINKNSYLILLLLFLVHLQSVHHKVQEYEMALNIQKITAIYIELIKFVLFIYYTIHLFACLWFWAGEYSLINYQHSWLNTLTDEWQQQYLQSFYYACVTMYTVGYGDITPVSNLEKVIAIILIMVSSIQLSYSINTVGNIIQKISFYNEERKNNLSIINQYMSRKNIPMAFQMQIREYLNKYWESKNQENSTEENNIILQLSEELQQKLMMYSNSAIIKLSPFLKTFSNQFKQTLLKKVQIQNLHPDKLLTFDDQFLAYIEEGDIDIIQQNSQNNILEKKQKGQFFGLKNFITGETITQQFKSQSFTKVLVIYRKDFLQIIKDYQIDFEQFCQIKDRLIFGKENHYIQEECKSCKLTTHALENCPLIHFIPQKDVIIKRHQFSNQQNRQKFKRKQRKRNILQMDKEQQNHFLEQYDQELKLYNLPYLINSDVDEFNQLPKFKIQQSTNNNSQMCNPNITIDQFEGIQRQVSLVTSGMRQNQRKQSYLQNNNNNNNNNNNHLKSISIDITTSLDEQLHNRLFHINCYKDNFKNEILQLELLIKYKKSLNEKNQNSQFECLYNFQAYNTHYNIEIIVKKIQNQQSKLNKLSSYINRFIKYLEYPAAFFDKYKHYQISTIRNNSFVDRIMEGD